MKYALISVSNKSGIVELAQELILNGYTILSSGGTYRELSKYFIDIKKIEDHTGYPEIMNGRVKTLHPKIHGGILGNRNSHLFEAEEHSIEWIDIVIVNLYPFKDTVAMIDSTASDIIENIDIGGPTLIRAAAKNHEQVTVVCNTSDYRNLINELPNPSIKFKKEMARKAFKHTADYDIEISKWFSKHDDFPESIHLSLDLKNTLRYGENPHQKAAVYTKSGNKKESFKKIQGKDLSYNNIVDMEACISAVMSFSDPGCVIVKHANPCGAATHMGGLSKAFNLALEGDPISSYGGIVSFNREVSKEDIIEIKKSRNFFEIICAPSYTPQALEAISNRKKIRVIQYNEDLNYSLNYKIKNLMNNWLVQEEDSVRNSLHDIKWSVKTKNIPTVKNCKELEFAWKMCKFVKSNAIVLACSKDGGIMLSWSWSRTNVKSRFCKYSYIIFCSKPRKMCYGIRWIFPVCRWANNCNE